MKPAQIPRQHAWRRLLDRRAPSIGHCSDHDLVHLLSGDRRSPSSSCPPLPSWTHGVLRLVNFNAAQLASTLSPTSRQARRFAAAFELHRRLSRSELPARPSAVTPELILALLRPWILADQEHFWCLALDARSHLVGDPFEISRGDVNGTDANPRSFFRAALRAGACSAIAVHHHPAGSVTLSTLDLVMTRQLATVGQVVQILLRDHLILVTRRWISWLKEYPAAFPGAQEGGSMPWMVAGRP